MDRNRELGFAHDSEEESVENRERQEGYERALDFIAENMLLNGVKVNEGQNGVIMHLDVDQLDPEFARYAKEAGVEFGSEQAVKVLKIYRDGAGAHEYEMHRRAYEALDNDPETEAIIPKPIFYRSFNLSPDAQERMREVTGKGLERAEVIAMDFIHGEDMAKVLAKEAFLRRRPDVAAEDVQNWSVERLLDEVGPMLGFAVPGGKGNSEGERLFEKKKVQNENADKLYRYLNEQGFVLDASILARLENTFKKLHSAGVIHRDAHERNVMLTGSYEAGGGKNTVYLIDFGASTSFEGTYSGREDDLYTDQVEGVRYYSDERILKQLDVLTKPPEAKRDKQIREEGEKLLGSMESFRRDEMATKNRRAWFERQGEKPVDTQKAVANFYKFFFKDAASFEKSRVRDMFADYLVSLIEEGKSAPEDVHDALVDLAKSAPSTPARVWVGNVAKGLLAIQKRRED